jgi:hypothetical protein
VWLIVYKHLSQAAVERVEGNKVAVFKLFSFGEADFDGVTILG